MTKTTPTNPAPKSDANDAVPFDALAFTRDVIRSLQALVGREEAAFSQSKGDAYKLLARLARAESRLAFAAQKKGTR